MRKNKFNQITIASPYEVHNYCFSFPKLKEKYIRNAVDSSIKCRYPYNVTSIKTDFVKNKKSIIGFAADEKFTLKALDSGSVIVTAPQILLSCFSDIAAVCCFDNSVLVHVINNKTTVFLKLYKLYENTFVKILNDLKEKGIDTASLRLYSVNGNMHEIFQKYGAENKVLIEPLEKLIRKNKLKRLFTVNNKNTYFPILLLFMLIPTFLYSAFYYKKTVSENMILHKQIFNAKNRAENVTSSEVKTEKDAGKPKEMYSIASVINELYKADNNVEISSVKFEENSFHAEGYSSDCLIFISELQKSSLIKNVRLKNVIPEAEVEKFYIYGDLNYENN